MGLGLEFTMNLVIKYHIFDEAYWLNFCHQRRRHVFGANIPWSRQVLLAYMLPPRGFSASYCFDKFIEYRFLRRDTGYDMVGGRYFFRRKI